MKKAGVFHVFDSQGIWLLATGNERTAKRKSDFENGFVRDETGRVVYETTTTLWTTLCVPHDAVKNGIPADLVL